MSTLVLSGAPTRPRRRNSFFRPVIEFLDGIRLARAMAHRYEVLSRKSDADLNLEGVHLEQHEAVADGEVEDEAPQRAQR